MIFDSILNREYSVPHRKFVVQTKDGVTINGVHLGDRGNLLLVYCHGLFSSKNFRRVPPFVEGFSHKFDIMAFDFRGHGESEGKCTLGREEVLDLKAITDYAHHLGYQKLVAIGASMGGATVIRTSGKYGLFDGIVTIGAFAQASHLGPLSTRLGLRFFFETRAGDSIARWTRGAHLGALADMEQPIDVVSRIEAPLFVIHGAWDPLIGVDQGRQLIANAVGPKDFYLVPRGGHVMQHLTPRTQELISDWIYRNQLDSPKHTN